MWAPSIIIESLWDTEIRKIVAFSATHWNVSTNHIYIVTSERREREGKRASLYYINERIHPANICIWYLFTLMMPLCHSTPVIFKWLGSLRSNFSIYERWCCALSGKALDGDLSQLRSRKIWNFPTRTKTHPSIVAFCICIAWCCTKF